MGVDSTGADTGMCPAPRPEVWHCERMDTHQPQDRPEHSGGLLTHDTLVMQQVTGFMSNDFDILDEHGSTIGRITTTGGAGQRFVLGNRSFDVCEVDGTVLVHVEDPMDFGFDTYAVQDATGAPIATIRKRFSFLRRRVDIEVAAGPTFELIGNAFGFEFTMSIGGQEVVQVARYWAGIGRGLLGHSRYVAVLNPNMPPRERLAVIGGLIALDLMRAKDSRSSN